MEKHIVSGQMNRTIQSHEFSRSSYTYPSPSTLISDSSAQSKTNSDKSLSQDVFNSTVSFKSPYDIEENQFNRLFNNDEDEIKDNNLRNDKQKKKIMESSSLNKLRYVTFILDNENKSNHSIDNSSGNKYSIQSSNPQRTQSHEIHDEAKNRLNQGENKNISNIQSRYLKTSNIDQRSARKSFIHPSAASTAILNRRLATAKSSPRKKDGLLGNPMPLSASNSQSESNPSSERIAKKSPVVSIIIENLY